jgi:hypothetical protein
MVMGDNDMVDYIDPRRTEVKNYAKTPEREFRLKQDIVVAAGMVFTRAPLERGGVDRLEGVVGLGKDATAYLNLPLRVAEIDAADWFEEVTGKSTKEENTDANQRDAGTAQEAGV